MKFYKRTIVLGFLLLTSFLIMGCTPFSSLLFGPPGSLNITTFPKEASVMINGKDSGYNTPCLVENLTVGEHQIELILADRDIQKTEKVIIYSDKTTDLYVDMVPHLNKIQADPTSMSLDAGTSQQINSVTAYYINDNSKSVNLSNCVYSSSSSFISVNNNGLITANKKGSALVTVSYTEEGITETDTVNINVMTDPVTLSSLEVGPSSMALQVGEEKSINSVIAYYSDASTADISLSDCDYSVNNDKVTVDNAGKVTGIEDGTSVITVSYTENGSTKTDTINVEVGDIEYRAFLVGVGDYINLPPYPDGDLPWPTYNVLRMNSIFEACKFGEQDITFTEISLLTDHDATKNNILQGILDTFSGADENDVSYFYYNGHGDWDFLTSYICPSDTDGTLTSYISVDALEETLSSIPGMKVVILDTCFSGGFIGKGNITSDGVILTNFNNEVITEFSQIISKDLLTSNQYQVITASHYDQPSYGDLDLHPTDNDPTTYFTRYLCKGCGYEDGILYADWDVVNSKINLYELYQYVKINIELDPSEIGYYQDTQAFPEDSNFTIFEY